MKNKVLVLAMIFGASITAKAGSPSTVPVPQSLQNPSSIQVKGKCKHQTCRMEICSYSKTASASASCEFQSLEEVVPLPPGDYLVRYENTHLAVTLADHQREVIELSEIKVPRIDGKTSVTIFKDYSDRAEQEKELLTTWVRKAYFETPDKRFLPFNMVCRMAKYQTDNPLAKAYCEALASSDFRDMSKAVTFDGETFSVASPDGDFSSGALVVTGVRMSLNYGEVNGSFKDGDTIFVFPGTYNLEFTNSAGQTRTQEHVRVH